MAKLKPGYYWVRPKDRRLGAEWWPCLFRISEPPGTRRRTWDWHDNWAEDEEFRRHHEIGPRLVPPPE